jgi:hypothetical protein
MRGSEVVPAGEQGHLPQKIAGLQDIQQARALHRCHPQLNLPLGNKVYLLTNLALSKNGTTGLIMMRLQRV